MKYGESAFDILYLLFAILSGFVMLRRASNRTERLMGGAALVLGCGDAFHLVPRVLNYFVAADFTAALGLGKLVTSVTMTIFYVLLYYIWLGYFRRQEQRSVTATLWTLTIIRIAICLFPQNGWLENGGSVTWAILRNIPFLLLGTAVCWMYYQTRREDRILRPVWVLIALSFLFYLPVAVGAQLLPILGMLMLPKTVCYILMLIAFLRAIQARRSRRAAGPGA